MATALSEETTEQRESSRQEPIRIFVADDHPIFREGLKHVTEGESGIVVVGEASSCSETYRKIEEVDCDILILDLGMPGRGGLALLKEIKEVKPDLPVLVVSVEPEEVYAVRTLKAGASGFLQKDDAGAEKLREAIHAVAAGERYITPAVATRLVEFLTAPHPDLSIEERLSDRELQVLRMLGSGKTVSEIGEELSLSVKTISTYRSRILDKTGLRTTAELIRFAIENDMT